MPSQHWDPHSYAQNAGFVAELGRDVVALLAPQTGERVLDLGCGDGALTEQLARAGCAVVGVDSSAAQVAGARARGLDARVLSGESLPFAAEFDAVFSNAALHWMRAADAVVRSVHRALRPGGRFVGELGGAGNVQTIRRALTRALARHGVDAASLDPWWFPTPDQYRDLLEQHGFVVTTTSLFPRDTIVPTDMAGWLMTFAQPFLEPLDDDARRAVLRDVTDAVRPRLYDAERGWTVDYVRLRFSATRPAEGVE
jgi:trans-aconitate methyltransferase